MLNKILHSFCLLTILVLTILITLQDSVDQNAIETNETTSVPKKIFTPRPSSGTQQSSSGFSIESRLNRILLILAGIGVYMFLPPLAVNLLSKQAVSLLKETVALTTAEQSRQAISFSSSQPSSSTNMSMKDVNIPSGSMKGLSRIENKPRASVIHIQSIPSNLFNSGPSGSMKKNLMNPPVEKPDDVAKNTNI